MSSSTPTVSIESILKDPHAMESPPGPNFILQLTDSAGERLFKSPTEVARGVLGTQFSNYRDLKSAAPPVAQVLNGDRPCPEHLRKAIGHLMETKLEGLQNREVLLEIVEASLQTRGRDARLNVSCEKPDFDLLLSTVRKCSHLVAVLPDRVLPTSPGTRLTKLLFGRLGIASGLRSDLGVKFELFQPTLIDARKCWYDLLAIAEGPQRDLLHRETVISKLRRCNEEGDVRVFTVPPIACGSAVIMADPEDPIRRKGFHLHVNHGDQKCRMCAMGAEGASDWCGLVLTGLRSGNHLKEVKFESLTT